RIGASRTVGLLAHYFGDTNNPLHTDQVAAEERIHSRYEQTVDRLTDARGKNSGWLRLMHFSRVTDPAAFTITDAQLAHGSYSALVAESAARGYDASVDAITRTSLNRAVEGMADIIGSIQLDAGYRAIGAPKAAVSTATTEATGAAPSMLGAVQDATGSGDPATSALASGAVSATGETASSEVSTTESDGSPDMGSVALGAAGACCGLLLVVVAVALMLWARKRRR
ncbi:MAG: hypothetical protein WCI74_16880, partial [Actinomycetes bacterium]